jgi:hypothetical protein
MSKVSRSDYAASCPWSGIIGKPSNLGGATDIGQLTGVGFANNQVPRYNVSLGKFRPYTLPSPPSPVTPTNPLPAQIQITWDAPSLLPLQSAFQDFPLIGALPGEPIAWGLSIDTGFCIPFACIAENDLIRLKLVNMDSVAVDLASTLWQIQRFPAS